MQKEDVITLITYLLMIGFIVGIGFGFVQPALNTVFGYESASSKIAMLVLSILIGLVLIAIIIEAGHAIGAKLGKYNIIAVNIFGFCSYKKKDEDGNIYRKFKFPRNFDGLTGETIISPKSENSKPIFYIFTPLFLFLIEVAITVFLFWYYPDNSSQITMMYTKYGSLIATAVGGMIMIYNYTPAKLDNSNDGYKLLSINKKTSAIIFNELLKVNESIYYNEEPEEIKLFDEINDISARLSLIKANLIAKVDFNKSIEIIDKYSADPKLITKSTFNTMKISKAYILFMYGELEDAKNCYINELNEEQRKLCTNCSLPLYIRTYALYEGLVEKSDSEIELAESKVKKALSRIPYNEYDHEKALIEEVFNKIKQ